MNPFFTHQIRVISDHPSVGMYRRLPNREGIIAPPTKGAGARSSPRLGSDFDTKMVIILGALLCSLLAALGLNSIIRCALRFRWRLGLETPEQAVARIAATGLRKKDLSRIPVGIYGSSAEIQATECPICLGEFVDGEKVRVLPMCNHGFHIRCIDTWLGSHSSCPTCRHSLIEQKAGSTSGSGSGAAG